MGKIESQLEDVYGNAFTLNHDLIEFWLNENIRHEFEKNLETFSYLLDDHLAHIRLGLNGVDLGQFRSELLVYLKNHILEICY